MSNEVIKQFVNKANQDTSIQAGIKSFTGVPEETYRKVIKLAKEHGFEFTEDEWKSFPICDEPGKSKHGFTEWSSEIIVPWLK
ncbi:MAG: Nif11-like leader peptide family natural product precursor [Candidatus Magnetomorum sp.]|nr:Nif11-like leader peptide family natural product precursor [Candidatus Magnetomorum sp.]